MNSTKFIVSLKKIEDYLGPLLVVPVGIDNEGKTVVDQPFKNIFDDISGWSEFSGKKEEASLIFQPGKIFNLELNCIRLLLVGVGRLRDEEEPDATKEQLRQAGGVIANQCKSHKISELAVCVPHDFNCAAEVFCEYLAEGILLGDYQFRKYKTQEKKDEIFEGVSKVEWLTRGAEKKIRRGLKRATIIGRSVCCARDMGNEPSNEWTAAHFADFATNLATTRNLKCTVLGKKQISVLAMGGIIAVNKGSEEPPKVVILDYSPKTSLGTILLVGKGLTFDSGGISLKPAQGMMEMKYDMCGGAAVLAAMEAISCERPPVRVISIVPATDNMADGGAFKPGDVIKHYGGITAEIESTDAEGRLILADAIAYGIEQYKPDCVLDIATLTGSVIMALGHHYAGLFSNNSGLAKRLSEIGKNCAEPLWQLPLAEVYRNQIKSQIADIKNTGGKPGGCITGAEYLHKFVGNTPWAHIDIAGTAWDFTEKTYIPKGPSGFGVRIFIEFVRRWRSPDFLLSEIIE